MILFQVSPVTIIATVVKVVRIVIVVIPFALPFLFSVVHLYGFKLYFVDVKLNDLWLGAEAKG